MLNRNETNGEFKNWLATKRQELVHREIRAWSGSSVCICTDCQKVRDEYGYWSEFGGDCGNSGADVTYGFCPDCLSRRHLEIDDYLGLT